MNRYIVGFLLAVGLIVLVVVLIVRSLVSAPSINSTTAFNLTDFAGTAATVRYTDDSSVVASGSHYDTVITVGNYESTLTVTQGYEGNVITKQSYPMSTSAYAVFLRALKYNGFTLGDNTPSFKDERGQCALGSRYIFQAVDANGNDVQRYWYASCGNGTFSGNIAAVRRLFTLQIPDYSKLTSGIRL